MHCNRYRTLKNYYRLLNISRNEVKWSSNASISQRVLSDLEKILTSKQILVSESVRLQHSKDESWHRPVLPAAVIFPDSVGQVQEVARICTAHKQTMIPFGTGTGMEGGVVPSSTAHIAVDLSKLNQYVEYHPEDMTATVEPGVTRISLNNYIKGDGLWFPVDPGADASVCGMAATSASGTNAVRYGTMRENVINLQVVLSDGTLLHTAGEGRRNRKTSAGYNLTNLFVGSEGTLGFITNTTVRLHGVPESMVSAVCSFEKIENCVEAVQDVLASGVPVARIELLDEVMIGATNNYSKLSLPVQPTLFLEFHGTTASTQEQAETVQEIVKSYEKNADLQWAVDEAERKKLWKARHDALYAQLSMKPGCQQLSTDVCVPISHLARVILDTKHDIQQHDLTGPLLGHVGDGNFHVTLIFDANNPDEVKEITDFSDRLVERALSIGGTCTGEHGIGIGKRKYLTQELGESTVSVMKDIKNLLDPFSLMNPDKVLP